jgi:hypothetical protein
LVDGNKRLVRQHNNALGKQQIDFAPVATSYLGETLLLLSESAVVRTIDYTREMRP